ncbi:glycosyltransferase [Microbacterium sp. LWS13-1.2]|uniref:Glycosyltransferase n=1 Tax=Microbacterium sp. LWS13-1.2 TaxID=3135264 RepID=A0AAU6SA14_9MICO
MRVLILTFGTRGDVEPFAALAQRLTAAGHTAVLAAPEPYRETVAADVDFEPMATEMDRVMRAGMTRLRGPAHALTLAREMAQGMRVSLQEQWQIAQQVQPTVIVGHPKALGGLHVAERLGLPFVASLPLPFLTPTSAFPVPFLSRQLPGSLNRISYDFNRFTALAYGGMINRFRRETLGLSRMSRRTDYLTTREGAAVPVLYPFSRHVVPVPADYPSSAHVTGYWFGESARGWEPPRDLAEFLGGDRPVIYLGFGSMAFGGRAEDRGRLVREALDEVGARAVVSTGWGALTIEPNEYIHPVDEVPHDWLFSRVDAVVHHSGSGTTAAGLRAGKPTLVCPVLGDQPFWGRRVHELGVGPRPLPLPRATSNALAARLAELLSNATYAASASTLSAQLASEDGPDAAIRVLEQIELQAGRHHGR